MAIKLYIVLSVLAVTSLAQRPWYARRPIGYPVISTTTTQSSNLGNRFGEDAPTTTTMKPPLEALGDQDLVNRLNAMPLDKRPFWLINWQALEEQRKRPQTYPLRPNGFVDFGQTVRQF